MDCGCAGVVRPSEAETLPKNTQGFVSKTAKWPLRAWLLGCPINRKCDPNFDKPQH